MRMPPPVEQSILLSSASLDLYQTTRDITCPYCEGRGDIEKNSFVVTKVEQGILYKCFRAKCAVNGLIPTRGCINNERRPPPLKPPKPFTRPLISLPSQIITWIKDKYNITEGVLRRNNVKYDFIGNYLYFPVYNTDGEELGSTIKKLPATFINVDTDVEYWKSQEKARHYITNTNQVFLYYPILPRIPIRKDVCVVVEDVLSALRLSTYSPSVALLGTSMPFATCQHIKKRHTKVILALDPDTWDRDPPLSLVWRDKYSLFFQSFRTPHLTKDPKDLSDTEIENQIYFTGM